jgi:uncharacterized protein with HEPN domain
MREPAKRLQDIRDAIAIVRKYAERGQVSFENELETQSVILLHMQIIGEAAFKLPDGIRRLDSTIPWESIEGMRHVIVHDYFRINPKRIWTAVENNLDELDAAVAALILKLPAHL